ncbi:hypothetical protein BOTBODRAFT_85315, partial [Botryobasidium botryosum FD-172 SS1]
YFIIVGGDQPAIAKLTNMKGHNAIAPCRTCRIYGCLCPSESASTYYYPLHAPEEWDGRSELRAARGAHYDAEHLPYRTHASHMEQVDSILASQNPELGQVGWGINGFSILSNLSSINFPMSFPFGMLHLVFLNTVPNLVRHAIGTFERVPNEGQPYAISPKTWQRLGAQLAASNATMPAGFGKHFRNISKEFGLMVAEDWSNFVVYAARPLFATAYTKAENRPHLELWDLLAEIVEDCLKFSISQAVVASIGTRIRKFVTEYERSVSRLS